mgnify:CR=1 FL=1
MKNSLLHILVALFVLLSLPACSNNADSNKASSNFSTSMQNDKAAVQTVAAESTTVAKQDGGKHAIVVYFSYSGNTKRVAEEIAKETGADLFRIETEKVYPSESRACTDEAKKEKSANERPKLKGQMPDLSKYDTVYIGYPCWWGTCPMAVLTFVEQANLEGKTIAPFSTHGGSGMTGIDDLRKATPKASLTEGLAIYDGALNQAPEKVSAWLKVIAK